MRGRSGAREADLSGANFMQLLEQIGREKGIDIEILISALEDAITTASRKQQERTASSGDDGESQEILVSRLNRKSGQIQLYARKLIVEDVADPNVQISLKEATSIDPSAEPGGHVELPRSTKGLGRIEAQAAKQVIFQKVREAERDIVYSEFKGKVGQIVNGSVKRFERGDIVVDLGRSEGLLPRRYQSRTEMYSQGDRVRATVVEVNRGNKGSQIVLARTDASLLIKLFEMEVPEIYDGTVVLRNAVREPGERSKVAVTSSAKDVDPVGACVGLKGSRVQAIIRELRGEKIDIVQWSEEIPAFAANALNPAKVGRVSISPENERTLEVMVDESQLSLAIGKRGQNVRLAAKLVGWRMDIKSEGDKRKQVEVELAEMTRRTTPLVAVPGITEDQAKVLEERGLVTIDDLLRTPLDVVSSVPTIGADGAPGLLEAASALVSAPLQTDDPVRAATSTGAEELGAMTSPALDAVGDTNGSTNVVENQ